MAWGLRLLASPAEMRRLHEALFETFFPGPEAPLPEAVRELAPAAREQAWQGLAEMPEVAWLVALLGRLRLLHSRTLARLYARLTRSPREPAGTVTAARQSLRAAAGRARSFADLGPAERRAFLDLLLTSDLAFHRRVGSSLRLFYLLRIYQGRLGHDVAGIAEPRSAGSGTPGPRAAGRLRYDAAARAVRGEVDTIVVGSGPAGCVVAHELHRAGRKVLVVEAGSFSLPGTFDGRTGLDFYESRGLRSTLDGGVLVLNGESVGGGATVNADLAFSPALPYIRWRFEHWRERGWLPPDLWTAGELEAAYAWVNEKIGTRHACEAEVNTHNRLLLDGGNRHGLRPSLYHLNTYAPGAVPSPWSDKRGPVETFLLPALADPVNPLALLADTRVTRILLRRGRAVGVECVARAPGVAPAGARFEIRADEVILAGGNLGSSALLLASGIRNPNVGRGFVMHPFILVVADFDRTIDAHLGTSSSVFSADYMTVDPREPRPDFLVEVACAQPDIVAPMIPGSAEQVYHVLSRYRSMGGVGVLLIDSVSPENRVTLDRRGRPQVHYALTAGDRGRFRRGAAEAVRMLFKAGARKVLLPTFEDLLDPHRPGGAWQFLTDIGQADAVERRLQFRANQTLLFAAHMAAGNKLGTDPARSVVSPQHRVWGTENLYVVDGSVFPTSVGANPMQSIYTIAKVFADRHLSAGAKA